MAPSPAIKRTQINVCHAKLCVPIVSVLQHPSQIFFFHFKMTSLVYILFLRDFFCENAAVKKKGKTGEKRNMTMMVLNDLLP